MRRRNIKRGLLRGWVVLTAVWAIAVLGFVAWQILGPPPCYAFDSISLNDGFTGQGADYVKTLPTVLGPDKTICGLQTSSELLSLESYAGEGAINQVSFAWKEPGGWSTKTRAELDVLNGKEITVSRITGDVEKYVWKARAVDQLPFLLVMGAIPLLILAIGTGVYWTVNGFIST